MAAEAATLGSMILDPTVIEDVQEIVGGAEAFYLREHQVLWLMILQVYEQTKGKAVDGVLVRTALESHNRLEEIGGLGYLREVIESVPSSASATYYAGVVRDHLVRRSIIQAGRDLAETASGPDDIESLVEIASATVTKLGMKITSKATTHNMMDLLVAAYHTLETDPVYALPCPPTIAHTVRGFQAGQMVVVCGRPSHGKTSFGLHLAVEGMRHCQSRRVVFFSFEMLPVDMMMRILSAETGIPFRSLTKDGLMSLPKDQDGHDGFRRIVIAQQYLADWDLTFVSGSPTPTAVAAQVRRIHRQKPVECVFVDYIQRMHCTKEYQSRDREVTVISNSLKNLALELQVPVVVLAQLNRGCESRPDHTPRLSDLRESGTIEQDADVVIALSRPDKYPDCPDDRKDIIEISVLKQRNGPEGKVDALFDGPTMAVKALAPDLRS